MNEINNTGMKRALLINDLSCIGKCSLGVAVPVVSAFGVEAVPLPTAMLSMQTCFDGYAFCDMTEQMKTFIAHWKKMNVKFDCIFTGFFGNVGQIEMTMDLIRDFAHDDTVVLVDPVIGDNGALYGFFGEEYIEAMRKLVSMAHVTTPNRTEAALLAGCPMDAPATAIMDALMTRLHVPNAVITSVAFDGDGNFADPSAPAAPSALAAPSASAAPSVFADQFSQKKIGYLARTSYGRFSALSGGSATFQNLPTDDSLRSGTLQVSDNLATADFLHPSASQIPRDLIIAKPLRPCKLHGTGDVFASALCGGLMTSELMTGGLRAGAGGSSASESHTSGLRASEINTSGSTAAKNATWFYNAVRGAADFCDQCVEATIKKQPGHWYGLAYEDVIASKR